MSADIIKLAVKRQLPVIEQGLPDIDCPTDMTVELLGVPGHSQAGIKAARRKDGSVRVIVMALDGEQLAPTDWVKLDIGGAATPAPPLRIDDGSIEGRNGARWFPLRGEGLQPESQGVDAAGQDIIAMVDTNVHCWELSCPECGRKRYAAKNNIKRVYLCRVCAKAQRRRAQNQWQRKQRSSSSQQTTTKTTTDEHGRSAQD